MELHPMLLIVFWAQEAEMEKELKLSQQKILEYFSVSV
jgi:hypothetical protein